MPARLRDAFESSGARFWGETMPWLTLCLVRWIGCLASFGPVLQAQRRMMSSESKVYCTYCLFCLRSRESEARVSKSCLPTAKAGCAPSDHKIKARLRAGRVPDGGRGDVTLRGGRWVPVREARFRNFSKTETRKEFWWSAEASSDGSQAFPLHPPATGSPLVRWPLDG